MNCILYDNAGNIKYYIKDCVKRGKSYIGSNKKLKVRRGRFLELWVVDDIDIQKVATIDGIKEAPQFIGRYVGSREDVNSIVKEEIAKKYNIEDEIKLLREKNSGMIDQTGWDDYHNYISTLVAEGKAFKDTYFPK